MDRQHRQDLKRDKFVDEIGILSASAKENQRLLVTIAAAAVAIAVIGYGIYFYRNTREQKAQAALSSAIETMDAPLLPQPGQQQQPAPGARYRTEAERNAAAEKQFLDVQKNHGGTDAADVAKLYLARIDAGRGDVSTARTLLQQFISDHPAHMLVGVARYDLYQLRINNGEAQQVISEVNAELAKAQPALPAATLLAIVAHAYDAQGNDAKSREAYKRIATEYPDSPYALEAQRRIGPA